MSNRNEHTVKNRFFGILSQFVDMTQRKIKQNLNYTDPSFLDFIIQQYSKGIQEDDCDMTEYERNIINISQEVSQSMQGFDDITWKTNKLFEERLNAEDEEKMDSFFEWKE